ncbi:zinc finger, CCHC-type, retrotransposon gag domain protein [Tanacetum coccineum]
MMMFLHSEGHDCAGLWPIASYLTAALADQEHNGIRNGVIFLWWQLVGGGVMLHPRDFFFMFGSNKVYKLKPLAFRSAATPAEAEDWITHMEKLFQVLGCPDNFKTRLAAFKIEGDALSWWKAHLRTQVGGDVFTDTCTWVAFREIFYNRYFPSSKQQRYEHEYGSIYQLDRENSGEYMERFTRLASFVGATAGDAQRQARHFKLWLLLRLKLSYCMRVEIRISGIEMVIGFRTKDRVSMSIGVVRTRVLSIGVVKIGVMIRDDRIFGVRIRGLMAWSWEMNARVRVNYYQAPATGVCQLGDFNQVQLQVMQVTKDRVY